MEVELLELKDKIKKLQKDNVHLRWQVKELKEERREIRKVMVGDHMRILERETDYKRHKDWRMTTYVISFASGALLMALATVIVMFVG